MTAFIVKQEQADRALLLISDFNQLKSRTAGLVDELSRFFAGDDYAHARANAIVVAELLREISEEKARIRSALMGWQAIGTDGVSVFV